MLYFHAKFPDKRLSFRDISPYKNRKSPVVLPLFLLFVVIYFLVKARATFTILFISVINYDAWHFSKAWQDVRKNKEYKGLRLCFCEKWRPYNTK